MLISDFYTIGNRLLKIRKNLGLTQAEVAELAGISDRTYADIERGSVNMRVETLLQICEALRITPDELFLVEEDLHKKTESEIINALHSCNKKELLGALKILTAYLDSL